MLKESNTPLDNLIANLNAMLAPAEELAQGVANYPEYSCLFIVGNSRCGSTFLLQWLASLNLFCYPTNLLSRFYMAPYIGSKIQ